jgi:hypothetical protein
VRLAVLSSLGAVCIEMVGYVQVSSGTARTGLLIAIIATTIGTLWMLAFAVYRYRKVRVASME